MLVSEISVEKFVSVQSCDVKLSTHFSVNLANDPTQLRKLKQILIFMLIHM